MGLMTVYHDVIIARINVWLCIVASHIITLEIGDFVLREPSGQLNATCFTFVSPNRPWTIHVQYHCSAQVSLISLSLSPSGPSVLVDTTPILAGKPRRISRPSWAMKLWPWKNLQLRGFAGVVFGFCKLLYAFVIPSPYITPYDKNDTSGKHLFPIIVRPYWGIIVRRD